MSAKLEIETASLEAFRDRCELAKERGRNAAMSAVYLEANNIMADAIEKAPKDIGTLRSSGYVTLPEGDPIVEMGFGGPAADYAVTVHEELFKNYTTPGTGPKYLENAINEHSRNLVHNLGALYDAAFEAGSGPTPTGLPQDPNSGGAVVPTGSSKSNAQRRASSRGRSK